MDHVSYGLLRPVGISGKDARHLTVYIGLVSKLSQALGRQRVKGGRERGVRRGRGGGGRGGGRGGEEEGGGDGYSDTQ